MTREERDERASFVRSAMDRFANPLVAYAAHLLRDPVAAEDVVQDVFLRLTLAFPDTDDRARVEPRLAPWLYTVCRNRAMDHLRKGRLMPRTNATTLDDRVAPEAPTEGAQRSEDAGRVLAALGTLGDGHREVLVLRLRHGLSYREIAEVTGQTVNHVGVRIHEAMKALRALLAPRAASPLLKGDLR
jgi:RNA polymerase sigma factor (sigma-70 family)